MNFDIKQCFESRDVKHLFVTLCMCDRSVQVIGKVQVASLLVELYMFFLITLTVC